MLRAFLLALAGLALAALLALGVFFASEAALLGDQQSPLTPAPSLTAAPAPPPSDTPPARQTTVEGPPALTTAGGEATTPTKAGDDSGRGRGRNRGRGGDDSSGSGSGRSGGSDDD